jgi:hypothetical protein
MLVKLFKNIVGSILDAILPPLPLPSPVEVKPVEPELVPELPPDPKEIAAQLRALADKIDPLVIPPFQASTSPAGWNKLMDEDGTTGGKVKRAGCGIQLNKRKDETYIDLDMEQTLNLMNTFKNGKETPETIKELERVRSESEKWVEQICIEKDQAPTKKP